MALKENHILKRAVAIQHERHREHESQAQELQTLKQSVAQYQEQLRKLEVSLHASSSCNLKLELGYAGWSSCSCITLCLSAPVSMWLICMSIVFAHVQVSNYALTMHLRTAQDSATSSITGRFHPDVF